MTLSLVELNFGMVLQRPANKWRLGGLNLEELKSIGGLDFLKMLLVLEFTVIVIITIRKC